MDRHCYIGLWGIQQSTNAVGGDGMQGGADRGGGGDDDDDGIDEPSIRRGVDEHAKLKTKLKTKQSSQPSYGTGFRYIGSPTTRDSPIGSPTTRDSAIGSPTTRDSAIGSPTTRDSAIGSRVKWGQVSLIPDESQRDPTKTKDMINADLRSPEFRK
jgi:hypothetical protein